MWLDKGQSGESLWATLEDKTRPSILKPVVQRQICARVSPDQFKLEYLRDALFERACQFDLRAERCPLIIPRVPESNTAT